MQEEKEVGRWVRRVSVCHAWLTPVKGEGREEGGIGRASDRRAELREPRQGHGEFWKERCP